MSSPQLARGLSVPDRPILQREFEHSSLVGCVLASWPSRGSGDGLDERARHGQTVKSDESRPPSAAPASGQEPVAGPVRRGERIELLDALRGFAIFGILLANVLVFSGSFLAGMAGDTTALPYSTFDQVTQFLVHLLVHGKFYSTFSLLFGVGFAVQLARAEALGHPFASFFRRRMGFLWLIGVMHALIWAGDILWLYAVVGLFLIPFRQCQDRTLLTWVAALLLAPVAVYGLVALLISASPAVADSGGLDSLFRSTFVAFSEGSSREVFEANFLFLLLGRLPALIVTGRPFNVLAMFLVGVYLGRRRVFHDVTAHRPLLRRLVVSGLCLGLIANVALALLMETDAYFSFQLLGLLQSAAYQIGVPALCLGYVSSFTLLFTQASWRRRLLVFAPVGRTALSNYVLQTFICLPIFYGIGLGQFGKWGVTTTIALVFVIYSVQAVISRWWLARFRFGPLEWLWRSLTYGRAQRMTHT